MKFINGILKKDNVNSAVLVLGVLVLFSVLSDLDFNLITILSMTIVFLVFNSVQGNKR